MTYFASIYDSFTPHAGRSINIWKRQLSWFSRSSFSQRALTAMRLGSGWLDMVEVKEVKAETSAATISG